MTRGNGSKDQNQEELLLDAADGTEAASDETAQAEIGVSAADNEGATDGESPADDAAPAATGAAPVERSLAAELVSTLDGCWMVTRHGKRVELSDEEWRKELAHALAPNLPPA